MGGGWRRGCCACWELGAATRLLCLLGRVSPLGGGQVAVAPFPGFEPRLAFIKHPHIWVREGQGLGLPCETDAPLPGPPPASQDCCCPGQLKDIVPLCWVVWEQPA